MKNPIHGTSTPPRPFDQHMWRKTHRKPYSSDTRCHKYILKRYKTRKSFLALIKPTLEHCQRQSRKLQSRQPKRMPTEECYTYWRREASQDVALECQDIIRRSQPQPIFIRITLFIRSKRGQITFSWRDSAFYARSTNGLVTSNHSI